MTTTRVAVDIGGTFVDAMAFDTATGEVVFRKASTTPDKPWEGVLTAVEALGVDLSTTDRAIHGTTLGLNAVLERRGVRTGIITNEGMRDIFLIGRGNVPSAHMYDFQYQKPESLVQRRHTVGVRCRMDYMGDELEPLNEDDVRSAAAYLVEEERVQSIAICFLHSYRNAAHEERAAAIIRAAYPEVMVACSTEIVREYREYERTSTTVLDAYIRPIFSNYVGHLEDELRERGLGGEFLIMRSGGGAMTAQAAKASPTNTVLSGPAGGVVGGMFVSELLGRDSVLTFDIGGTSLDTCVIENHHAITTHEASLETFPLLVPTYDIRTIGAGGGSIAHLDGTLLRVGPRSAGAVPGPVCYGRGGTEPTVTDAAVCLGYIAPETFLGGDMELHVDAARAAVQSTIAEPLGIDTDTAAAGVFDVMLAKTVGAVRQITVERGRDPHGFSLLAFGGAGPLVAPLLAREMGIGETIVPFAPSGFSAWGMFNADVVHDVAQTLMEPLAEADLEHLEREFAVLEGEATAALVEQSIDESAMVLARSFDVRYVGQEHTLSVAVSGAIDKDAIHVAFQELHEARYGHNMDNPLQILNVRVRGIGRISPLSLPKLPGRDGDVSRALTGTRNAYDFAARAMAEFHVYDRTLLAPGDHIAGPALINEGTSTTVIHGDQSLVVEEHGFLQIATGAAQ